jgi:hypothetical protein
MDRERDTHTQIEINREEYGGDTGHFLLVVMNVFRLVVVHNLYNTVGCYYDV